MATTGPLNDQARAIVEAVLEALVIPYAATTSHAETRQRTLDSRIAVLIGTLSYLTEATGDLNVDTAVRILREGLAEHPATGYVTVEQAQQRLRDRMDWMRAVGQVES